MDNNIVSQLIFKINIDNKILNMSKRRMTALLNSKSFQKDIGVYFELIEDGTIFQIFKNMEAFEKQNQYTINNIKKIINSKRLRYLLPIGNIMQLFPFPDDGLTITIEGANKNAKSVENFEFIENTFQILGDGIEIITNLEEFKAKITFKNKKTLIAYVNLLNQRYLRK